MRTPWSFQRQLNFNPVSEGAKDKISTLEKIVEALPDRIFSLIESDLTEGVKNPYTGRSGMQAEQVLRVALIKQIFGLSYRDLHFRLEDSNMIRRFAGYEFRMVPKKSALCDNIAAIRDETWEEINDGLVRFAVKNGMEDLDRIRIDTTSVESNIHHPTDATLLEDGIRVISRMCKQARKRWVGLAFEFHDRTRTGKKLSFKVTNAKNEEERQKLYRKLLIIAEETLQYGFGAVRAMRAHDCRSLEEKALLIRVSEDLKDVCDLLNKVIHQTRQRVIEGKAVSASDKVTSIFEPHTDILEKGKRTTEYGHKVCLTMGRKLIVHADILDGNPADTASFEEPLLALKRKFRITPSQVATDQGFGSASNAFKAASLGVDVLSFSGKRVAEEARHLVVNEGPLRKVLDRFRAGAEGMISAVKRAGSGLKRCIWKGYEHFCSYVWSVIAAYNVKEIAGILCQRLALARKETVQGQLAA